MFSEVRVAPPVPPPGRPTDAVRAEPRSAVLMRIAVSCGVATVILAALELVRVLTGVSIIPEPVPGTVRMPWWAAAGHVLLGSGLLAVATRGHARRMRWAVAAVAAVSLAANILSLAFHLWPAAAAYGLAWLSGARPIGGVTRALESAALLLTAVRRQRPLAIAMAAAVTFIGAAIVLGRLYGGPLVTDASWPQVNLAAALIAIAEGMGLAAVNGPTQWPLRLFAGPTVTAMLLRWFLPFAALAVLVTDIATIRFFHGFSPGVGSVVNTIVSIGGAAVLTVYIGRIIDGRIQRSNAALSASERALRRSLGDLRALSTRLNGIREQERGRIARDVHDHLGQALTALKLDMAELRRRVARGDVGGVEQRIGEMTELVDTAAEDVRRVASELRPPLIDELGFVDATRAYVADVNRRSPFRCTLSADAGTPLKGDVAIALFRILQEALTNVTRHAEARNVRIAVTRDDAVVRLEVADDGKGMPAANDQRPRGLGLAGMGDRARLFGGDVSFRRGPQGGVIVTAWVRTDGGDA
jgi:signal transduction histidine kinase